MRWLMVGGLCVVLMMLTGVGWAMASRGVGLSNDLRAGASVRAGSVTGSRVLVGGGVHAGK